MKEVKVAFLRESVSIPGTAINNDLTISKLKQPKIIKMAYDGKDLLVMIEDKLIIIPGSNIRGMELVERIK